MGFTSNEFNILLSVEEPYVVIFPVEFIIFWDTGKVLLNNDWFCISNELTVVEVVVIGFGVKVVTVGIVWGVKIFCVWDSNGISVEIFVIGLGE